MQDSSLSVCRPVRNTCLGFFEMTASMLVVFIHIHFPGIVGELAEGLARFAVPLFFTVSGFYLIEKGMTEREVRAKLRIRIRRVGKITLFSFGLYFILLGGQAMVTGTFPSWLARSFQLRAWVKLILFNDPLLMVTNWFLVALLFCYFIIFLIPAPFVHNKTPVKIIACFLPVWVIVRLIMLATGAEAGGYLLADAVFYRSWYAAGLPFLCFGMLLKQKEEKLLAVSVKVLFPGLIISFIEMITANCLFIHLLGDSIAYYFGSISVVFFIMCIAVRKPAMFCGCRFINAEGCTSMLLYIVHPAVIGVIRLLVQTAGIDQIGAVLWLEPLFALAFSVLLAAGVNAVIVRTS